jgi:hypothetical protein
MVPSKAGSHTVRAVGNVGNSGSWGEFGLGGRIIVLLDAYLKLGNGQSLLGQATSPAVVR